MHDRNIMTRPVGEQIVFKNLQSDNLFAGGFMIAISLLALWLMSSGRSHPRATFGFIIVSVIFLAIGLMGIWDADRTHVATTAKDQITITRIRFVTNGVLEQQELAIAAIGYIHYARSLTRGGGLWLVLRSGARIELASISRSPLPIAIWPSSYIIRAKAQRLSNILDITFVD